MEEGRYEGGKKEGEEGGKGITTTGDQYVPGSPVLLVTAP